MKYRMELTNGNTFWTKHFSADEQGMLNLRQLQYFFIKVRQILYLKIVLSRFI